MSDGRELQQSDASVRGEGERDSLNADSQDGTANAVSARRTPQLMFRPIRSVQSPRFAFSRPVIVISIVAARPACELTAVPECARAGCGHAMTVGSPNGTDGGTHCKALSVGASERP
jgi:hypothetical protein